MHMQLSMVSQGQASGETVILIKVDNLITWVLQKLPGEYKSKVKNAPKTRK